jgi:REP element-mobilizing transposase RayT
MPYDPSIHHRRSIRLKGWDYTTPGAYFVTIVVQGRAYLLDPSPVRAMVRAVWESLPQRFPAIRLDEFVIMPNHVHFIVWITVGADLVSAPPTDVSAPPTDVSAPPTDVSAPPTGGAHKVRPYGDGAVPSVGADLVSAPPTDVSAPPTGGAHKVRPYGDGAIPPVSLGRIVQAFKSITTVEYIRGVKEQGWTPFSRRLWQRNYYERIIRNEQELQAIRRYIRNNPARWAEDREYPG